MANASLNIPITGDASQFLAEVDRALEGLKKLQTEFNNAFNTKGNKLKLDVEVANAEGSIADLKQKIKDLETTRNSLAPFDIANFESANIELKKYKDEIKRLQGIGIKLNIDISNADGSIADLRQKIKELEGLRDSLPKVDTANFELANRQIKEYKDEIKRLQGIGIKVDIDVSNVQGSIADLRQKIKDLETKRSSLSPFDIANFEAANTQIKEYKAEIKRLEGLGVRVNIEMPPTGSIADLRNQIKELTALRDIEVDTSWINELNAEINRLENRIKQIKGTSVQIDIETPNVEGSIADLRQKIKSLEAERATLSPFDISNFEAANIKIKGYEDQIKRLQGAGVQIDIEPPPPGSINDIKRQIALLIEKKNISVGLDLSDANVKIQDLKALLKTLDTQGIEIDIKPINPILENSIAGLEKQLSDLRNKSKNIDLLDEREIARTNDQIKVLESSIAKYNSLSIDPSGKLTQSSAKARQALTSLSLVAQDLPFGFIAIQNNLPAVLQTFSELKTESKGSGGALKELSKSLVGPAGVFLAFSAVTAVVTYAIKEYGSLTNAVNVLIGANGTAVQAQVAFNKELDSQNKGIGGNIAQIQILVKNFQDETATQVERLAAYRALKEINPDIVAGIDEQNLSTATSIQLIGENAQAVINLIRVQTRQKAISKVLDDLEGKRLIANGKLKKANQEELDLRTKIAKINEKSKKGEGLTLEEIQIQDDAVVLLGIYGDKVANARKEVFEINGVQEEWYKSFEPLVNQTSKASSALETLRENLKKLRDEQRKQLEGDKKNKIDFKFDLILSDDYKELSNYNSLDKSIDRLKQYADIVLDVNKTEKERSEALKKLSEDSLNVYGINEDLFKSFEIGKTPLKNISQAIDIYGYKLQDLILANVRFQDVLKNSIRLSTNLGATFKSLANEITGANIKDKISSTLDTAAFEEIKALAEGLPKGFIEAFREFDGEFPTLEKFKDKLNEILQLEFAKTGKIDLAKISEIINAELAKLKAQVEVGVDAQFNLGLQEDFDKLSKIDDLFAEVFPEAAKRVEELGNTIQSYISAPLTDIFDILLKDGEKSWKDFGKTVIGVLKRIAVQIAATAIASAIANILAPGSGVAVSKGLSKISDAGLADYLDFTNFIPTGRGGRQANFGNIRGNQAFAMSGQVNMVLRGNDLIGSMNRTNSTINRVG